MGNGIELLLDAWDRANEHGQMLGIFQAALIYLIVRKQEKNPILYQVSLLLFLLLFNPFMVMLFVPEIVPGKQYYLVFQCLPVLFVIAYAFVGAVKEREKKQEKWIVASGLLITCVLACGVTFSRTRLERVENSYRISEEALEICDTILAEEERCYVIAPNELMEYVEAYTDRLQFYYDLELMQSEANAELYEPSVVDLYEAVQYGEQGIGKITSRGKEFGCSYLIIAKTEASLEEQEAGVGAYIFHESWAMEEGGYVLVLDTAHYVVYKDSTL